LIDDQDFSYAHYCQTNYQLAEFFSMPNKTNENHPILMVGKMAYTMA